MTNMSCHGMIVDIDICFVVPLLPVYFFQYFLLEVLLSYMGRSNFFGSRWTLFFRSFSTIMSMATLILMSLFQMLLRLVPAFDEGRIVNKEMGVFGRRSETTHK